MFARLVFTGFAAATIALAQGSGSGMGADTGGLGSASGLGRAGADSMGGEMGGGGMGGGSRGQKETKADLIVSRLKLSGDQKSEFTTILVSTAKDAQPMIQQLLKARQDIANALLKGKTDADLAPLNQALSDAQFQMTGVEVKTFQRLVALLKPNQVAKAPEAFDLMSDIFIPPPMRGRGGR